MNQEMIKEVNEACKELIKLSNIDVGRVEPGNIAEMKRKMNDKGYDLKIADLKGPYPSFLTVMYFKDEFIAGYKIVLDLRLSVIKRMLIQDKKDLKGLI